MNIVWDILADGLLAAIAGIGFGAISHPPRRAFVYIALLAAIGHALRFCLMTYAGLDIATSSFAAGLTIGMTSVGFARLTHCPMTVLYIPALLPMIPGMYAYRTIFALVMSLQNLSDADMTERYMREMFTNGTVAVSVVFLLAVGATLPNVIFHKLAFSMTRGKRKDRV
jgi:uncharacterized membrane protein YjjB (DUF3815 family)